VADFCHVGELHVRGVGAELLAEPVDLPGRDDDERRLAERHALEQERRGRGDEGVVAVVEQRFVAEAPRSVGNHRVVDVGWQAEAAPAYTTTGRAANVRRVASARDRAPHRRAAGYPRRPRV
jgi:hypothetical protein